MDKKAKDTKAAEAPKEETNAERRAQKADGRIYQDDAGKRS